MRKWIIRIVICGLIGGAYGWFWHHELEALYKRTQAVEAKYRVGKEKPVKIYQGKWHSDFLEVIK